MNVSIEREIKCLKRLGARVEVKDDEIVIYNEIVPDYIAETFVKRIKQADTKNKYRVTIRPA